MTSTDDWFHCPNTRDEVSARFFKKLDVRDVADPDACWHWRAATVTGYGKISIRRETHLAHRVAWMLRNGPVPDGLFILHSCDNRLCCNPAHLRPGTHADNMLDKRLRGRAQQKLTAAQVEQIHLARWFEEGATLKVLSTRYGVSMGVISQIVNGHCWRHVSV